MANGSTLHCKTYYTQTRAHTIPSKAISVSTRAHKYSRSLAMLSTNDDGVDDSDSDSRCDGVTLARPRHNFFLVIDSNHYDVIYFFLLPPASSFPHAHCSRLTPLSGIRTIHHRHH